MCQAQTIRNGKENKMENKVVENKMAAGLHTQSHRQLHTNIIMTVNAIFIKHLIVCFAKYLDIVNRIHT